MLRIHGQYSVMPCMKCRGSAAARSAGTPSALLERDMPGALLGLAQVCSDIFDAARALNFGVAKLPSLTATPRGSQGLARPGEPGRGVSTGCRC